MNEEKLSKLEGFIDSYLGQEAKIPHNLDRGGIAYADYNVAKVVGKVAINFGGYLLTYSNIVGETWFDSRGDDYTTEELFDKFIVDYGKD